MPISRSKLELLAKRAVFEQGAGNKNSLKDLEIELFGNRNVSLTIRNHIKKLYVETSIRIIKSYSKLLIHEAVTNCDAKFIREVEQASPNIMNAEYFKTGKERLIDLGVDEKIITRINAELWKYFSVLVRRFASRAPEINLRRLIVDWFDSGEISLENYKKWEKWKEDQTLEGLKNIQWALPTPQDLIFSHFKDTIQSIPTTDFVDKETLKKLMEILLKPMEVKVTETSFGTKKEKTLEINSRTLFLSRMIEELKNEHNICIDKTNEIPRDIVEIEIFAKTVFHIDRSWTIPGVNIVLVSDKVRLWNDQLINVSGKSVTEKLKPAKDGMDGVIRDEIFKGIGEDGVDGIDGLPGESSGNIAIITQEIFNQQLLTLKLNGGNGQDGQDGGKGGNGRDGFGIEKFEFERTEVQYSSIYFKNRYYFFNYEPKQNIEKLKGLDNYEKERLNNWKLITDKRNVNDQHYVYKEFIDRYGRKLLYSYSAWIGKIYNSYELYLLIEGTEGSIGGKGGLNGCGGAGGNKGECTIIIGDQANTSPFTGIIHNNSGKTGTDGNVGKNGYHGENGRDMALIDKSQTTFAKFYIGGNDKVKLRRKYFYSSAKMRRIEGYRKYELHDTACFVEFEEKKIDNYMMRRETREKKRSNELRKTNEAKKSISLNKVMEKASELFVQDDSTLAAICQAQADLQEEDIEEEAQESIEEEITVLQDRKNPLQTRKSNEKAKKKLRELDYYRWLKSLGFLKMVKKLIPLNVANALMDLFMVELNVDQLKDLDLYIFPLIFNRYERLLNKPFFNTLLNNMQVKIYQKISLTNILTNRRAKMSYASFRREASIRFDDYINSKRLSSDDKLLEDECFIHEVTPIIDKSENIFNFTSVEVKSITSKFFKWYSDNDVDIDLLIKAQRPWKLVYEYCEKMKIFEPQNEFNWLDEQATVYLLQKFFPSLRKTWWEEAKNLKKKIKDEWSKNWGKSKNEENENSKESKNEEDENSTEIAHEVNEEDALNENETEETAPIELEKEIKISSSLETLIYDLQKFVAEKFEDFNKNFKEFKSEVDKSDELKLTFGQVPHFDQDAGKNEQCILYLVKFYHQFKQVFIFQRHLYQINCLANEGVLHPTKFIKDENHNENFLFRNVLEQIKKAKQDKKMVLSDVEVEEFMLQHGFNSAAFRYLYAHTMNKNVRIYGDEFYGTMKLLENFNPISADAVRLSTVPNHDNLLEISADTGLREMLKQRHNLIINFKDFENLIKNFQFEDLELDFTKPDVQHLLASYFPIEFYSKVIEWIQKYIVVTTNQTLLKLFIYRFMLDGNHISLPEFQFILNTAMILISLHSINEPFVFAITSTFPQTKLVNAFLYVRIETILRRRISPDYADRIMFLLEKIEKTNVKSLLAAKLNEAMYDEITIIQILKMLEHTADSQLEKMSLSEWIDIAKHQKWSEIGDELSSFGQIGYYFSFLDHNRHPKEPILRNHFKTLKGKIMLEKVIARLAFLIVNGEIEIDEFYLEKLRLLANQLENHRSWYIINFEVEEKFLNQPFPLITIETAQNQLLKKLESSNYEPIFSSGDRNIDELKKLLISKNASKNDSKIQGSFTIEWIENIILGLKSEENEIRIFIDKIDKILYEKRGIHFRDTQKVTIMSIIKSERNLLAQVNTGEGKSYIIAAIAIIRATLQKYSTVDIITSSSVLAQRDSQEMADIYAAFGLFVGHNCDEDIEKRKIAYKSHIVYGDIARFQRDYLLHTFYKRNILGDRQRSAVIVDEVDNMLLDNGNNMLYLSHQVAGLERLDSLFVFIHKLVYIPMFNTQQKKSDVDSQFETKVIKEKVLNDLFGRLTIEDLTTGVITSQEAKFAYEKLIERELIKEDGYLNGLTDAKFELLIKEELKQDLKDLKCNEPLISQTLMCLKVIINRERQIQVPSYLHAFIVLHLEEYIENCKRAMLLQHNNEYVIDIDHTKQDSDLQPKVTIIDQNTGVDLATSQWSEGLHQCVQLKHGCRILSITLKAVFISNVSYLKGYTKINGLSGTLGSIEESRALVDLYEAELIRIPTSKPKDFYEKIPIICKTNEENEWINHIYNQIRDQINADRSVLVICQSIDDVIKLEQKLREKYEIMNDSTMKNCFESVIIYTREFDEFDFNKNPLKSGKLIISTNLAGRGTDIKLDEKVKQNGGLHVVVTFLPENCRIEDQAYGRAARSGDPGSAQIITLVKNEADEKPPPSVFQLKEFRDNAEVHRLKSLKNYYQYHTEIEELCLEKFRSHCMRAFESISQASLTGEDVLPDLNQVIYFALLDNWALWLDHKSTIIKHCAKTCNEKEKKEIIDSVEEFLKAHPLDPTWEAEKWINAPQPLLLIALIHFQAQNWYRCKQILDRIGAEFPEFLEEAFYYRALIEQMNIRQPKPIPEDIGLLKGVFEKQEQNAKKELENKMKESQQYFKKYTNRLGSRKDKIKELLKNTPANFGNLGPAGLEGCKLVLDLATVGLSTKIGTKISHYGACAVDVLNLKISQAIGKTNETLKEIIDPDLLIDQLVNIDEPTLMRTQEFFNQSRHRFALRRERRDEAMKIVTRIQDLAGPSEISVRGFVEQSRQLERINECILANIDDMLGGIVDWHSFNYDYNPVKAYRTFKILQSQGFISPNLLCLQETTEQLEAFKRQYFISKKILRQILKECREEDSRETFHGWIVMSKALLEEKISLPSREDFWEMLSLKQCFERERQCFYADETRSEEVSFLSQLEPLNEKWSPFVITLSNSDNSRKWYTLESLEKLIINEGIKAEELGYLIDEKIIVRDKWASIDLEKFFTIKLTEYTGNYESVTAKQLADFLEIPELDAKKIMSNLIQSGIFESRQYKMRRFVQAYQPADLELAEKTIPKESMKHIFENFINYENISDEMIQILFDLKTFDEVSAAIKKLQELKILEDYIKIEYVLVARTIDCSVLPKCIQDDVEAFLIHSCSFALAYNCLEECLIKSIPPPNTTDQNETIPNENLNNNTKNVIFLPWKPHEELFDDFVKYGLVLPRRFEYKEESFVEYDQFPDPEEVRGIIEKRRSMLTQQKAKLKSTHSYFVEKGVNAPPDVKQTVINSLKQVATISENTIWKWWLAVGIIVGVVLAVIIATVIAGPIAGFLGISLLAAKIGVLSLMVVAAIGTTAYYMQSFRANFRTVTPVKRPNIEQMHQWVGEYTTLLAYNEKAEEQQEVVRQNAVLIKQLDNILNKCTKNLQSNFINCALITEETKNLIKKSIQKHDLADEIIIEAIETSIENSSATRFIHDQFSMHAQQYAYGVANKLFIILEAGFKNGRFEVGKISNRFKKFGYKNLGQELIDASIKNMMRKFAEDFEQVLKQKESELENLEKSDNEKKVNNLCEVWVNKLSTLLSNKIGAIITNIFYSPVKELLNDYIENEPDNYEKKQEKSNKEIEFEEEKRQLTKKYEIIEKNNFLAVTKYVQHIEKDAEVILRIIWNKEENIRVLYHMIQYNYPLPPIAFPIVIETIYNVLKELSSDTKFGNACLIREAEVLIQCEKQGEDNLKKLEVNMVNGGFTLISDMKNNQKKKISMNLSLFESFEENFEDIHDFFSSAINFKQVILVELEKKQEILEEFEQKQAEVQELEKKILVLEELEEKKEASNELKKKQEKLNGLEKKLAKNLKTTWCAKKSELTWKNLLATKDYNRLQMEKEFIKEQNFKKFN